MANAVLLRSIRMVHTFRIRDHSVLFACRSHVSGASTVKDEPADCFSRRRTVLHNGFALWQRSPVDNLPLVCLIVLVSSPEGRGSRSLACIGDHYQVDSRAPAAVLRA